jgi:hypothetical protein
MLLLLLILSLLEIFLVTSLQNFAGPYLSPLLLLIVSLSISFLYLRIRNISDNGIQENNERTKNVTKILQIVIFCLSSWLIYLHLVKLFVSNPILDKTFNSDIIPQIKFLVKRYLHGEQPYYTIKFNNYELYPTYLPFQWAPYLLAEWLQTDYRWIPSFAFWFVSLYFFIKNTLIERGNKNLILQLIIPIWPLIVWGLFIKNDNDLVIYSVEALIAAFYLFVSESIFQKYIFQLAIGIAICLFSRYSLIFWAPLCISSYFIKGEKKKALIVIFTLALFFIIFYWFPFLRKDPLIFLKGYAYHTNAAYYEWQGDIEHHAGAVYLFNGLGFTAWAMKLIPGSLYHILNTYRFIHILLCVLIIITLLFYLIRMRRTINLQVFLLFSFKIYLSVFYAFIQIPYKYLYIVPVIVSASLLIDALNKKNNYSILI